MSVIVKGMDMPKNCAYCPLSEYRNTSLGQILDCKRIGTVGSAVRSTHDVLNHRHPNCPLVDSPEPHWIPCGERLPEDGKQVLVYARGARYALAKYDEMMEADGSYKKQWVTFDAWKPLYTIKEVMAWMPLPEPFKGVTE